MNGHTNFKMESRPYGGGYANFVGIECGWCHTEAWHPAKNGGWAIRIFRATGWKVGSKRGQDRCPVCFGKARFARKKPDNPVISPELGKAIKQAMDAQPPVTKSSLLVTSGLIPDPITVWERVRSDGPARDPSPPTEPQSPPAPVPEPAMAQGRKNRSKPGITVITRRDNAVRAARLALGKDVKEGVEFYTVPLKGGWTWILAADISPRELENWTPIHRTGPRKRSEVQPPHPSEKGNAMTAQVTPIRKDPMPTPLDTANKIAAAVDAAAPREITREERGRIHDELTKVYDIVAERYVGNDSDKVVAARLDVPRKGVTDIRVMFFGEHDRNQQTEKHKLELDKSIELVRAAVTRLMEMAAEAETLEQSLMAARKKLEG